LRRIFHLRISKKLAGVFQEKDRIFDDAMITKNPLELGPDRIVSSPSPSCAKMSAAGQQWAR
jgi:hypothetical protein